MTGNGSLMVDSLGMSFVLALQEARAPSVPSHLVQAALINHEMQGPAPPLPPRPHLILRPTPRKMLRIRMLTSS